MAMSADRMYDLDGEQRVDCSKCLTIAAGPSQWIREAVS